MKTRVFIFKLLLIITLGFMTIINQGCRKNFTVFSDNAIREIIYIVYEDTGQIEFKYLFSSGIKKVVSLLNVRKSGASQEGFKIRVGIKNYILRIEFQNRYYNIKYNHSNDFYIYSHKESGLYNVSNFLEAIDDLDKRYSFSTSDISEIKLLKTASNATVNFPISKAAKILDILALTRDENFEKNKFSFLPLYIMKVTLQSGNYEVYFNNEHAWMIGKTQVYLFRSPKIKEAVKNFERF